MITFGRPIENSSSNISFVWNSITGQIERQPSYSELRRLLEDCLENLRLMRLHDNALEISTIVAGYELFDRWQAIRGLPSLGSEFLDHEEDDE